MTGTSTELADGALIGGYDAGAMALQLGEEVVLDPQRAELTVAGERVTIQSRVFSLIVYLVQQRHRVVPKDELLRTVWEGTTVSDSAIQRAISLARKALGPAGDSLATYPRRGYRFKGEVTDDAAVRFRPRYTQSGDTHIAYVVDGDGPVDFVVIHGWAFPMAAMYDEPNYRRFWVELSRRGRAISFDKRGTGMSDRVKDMPTLRERVDDLRAVLDDVGSERAVILGLSEGAPLAIAMAATHPQRVAGLLLVGGFARMGVGPGYPFGWNNAAVERLRGYVRRDWGHGSTVLAAVPSIAEQPQAQAWAGAAELSGASPGAALDLLAMNLEIDAREHLPDVACPTIVMHSRHDPVIDPACGRHLAETIPGAELRELDVRDHLPMMTDQGRAELWAAADALVARSQDSVRSGQGR